EVGEIRPRLDANLLQAAGLHEPPGMRRSRSLVHFVPASRGLVRTYGHSRPFRDRTLSNPLRVAGPPFDISRVFEHLESLRRSLPMQSDPELLAFFKALADASRLRIVGLLARKPHTVEELAALLGLRASTVSHHLARLVAVNLVSARADGHYHVYSLDTDALAAKARHLLAPADLPEKAAPDV